jgi:hypothetical protein
MPAIPIRNQRKFVNKAGWFTTLILALTLGQCGRICHAQNTHIATCGHTTVDDNWGPEFASQAKLFLARLKRIAESDDKTELSLLVQYPIHVYKGNHTSKVENPAELIRQYPPIMSPSMKRIILSQSPECLFATGQGVMIGDGNIWFQREKDGQMKIITITLDFPGGGRPLSDK